MRYGVRVEPHPSTGCRHPGLTRAPTLQRYLDGDISASPGRVGDFAPIDRSRRTMPRPARPQRGSGGHSARTVRRLVRFGRHELGGRYGRPRQKKTIVQSQFAPRCIHRCPHDSLVWCGATPAHRAHGSPLPKDNRWTNRHQHPGPKQRRHPPELMCLGGGNSPSEVHGSPRRRRSWRIWNDGHARPATSARLSDGKTAAVFGAVARVVRLERSDAIVNRNCAAVTQGDRDRAATQGRSAIQRELLEVQVVVVQDPYRGPGSARVGLFTCRGSSRETNDVRDVEIR